MPRILIRDGLIVSDGYQYKGNILIKGETIAFVDKKIVSAADEVIDASGCMVFPGGIDPHVHMKLRTANGLSSDDFVSGTRAALAGGTTTVIDFVTPRRGESLLTALTARKASAKKSLCDYGMHMSVTAWNDQTFSELDACCRQEGIQSVKAYLAYKETIGLEDDEFLALLDAAHKLNFLTMVHAESGNMVAFLQDKLLAEGNHSASFHPQSRPAEAESDAINRALIMAHLAGVPLYIVHVSTRLGLDAIIQAQQRGQNVIAETCPQYLLLDDSCYNKKIGEAAIYVMSPPLRKRVDQKALWAAMEKGVIETVSSDHCPFNVADKWEFAFKDFTRIPNGVGGVEYRIPLLYTYGVRTGRISLTQFVDLVSTHPAEIFGLYPRKGTLSVGSDADIVVWDPKIECIISAGKQWQQSDNTVYQGLKLNGGPRIVFSRGTVVFKDGKVTAKEGHGRFLVRKFENVGNA